MSTPEQEGLIARAKARAKRLDYLAGDPYASGMESLDAALLRELIKAAEPHEDPWQDISTAPMDGTVVDVWLGDGDDEDLQFYCAPGSRRSCDWAWREGKLRPVMGLQMPVVTVRPTHWIRRPPPPSERR